MRFLSFLKRDRRTNQARFNDYRTQSHIQRHTARLPRTPEKHISEAGRKIRAWFRLILVFGTLAALLYLLLFSKIFTIQKIEIKGDDQTLQEQEAIHNYLKEYLGNNLLLFSSRTHEQVLVKDYVYLKTLKIHRNVFKHGLVVSLETYEHVSRVQVNLEDGSQKNFIVNELGYISGIESENSELPLIIMDGSGADMKLELNQALIPKEELEVLLQAAEDFEGKFNMKVLETRYLKRARELHLLTERNFVVWIDLTQPVENQLSKLKKSLTEINIYEDPLLYIDLRISGQSGEKVIYKLQ